MKKPHARLIRTALLVAVLGFLSESGWTLPEYAAFSGSNCMSCHVGPMGGFGRKPLNIDSPGYITDKFFISGDMQFLLLADQRDPGDDRVVFFPMVGSLSGTFKLTPQFLITASQDFGILREVYGMATNEKETLYGRAGYFTLPYGILFPDHTSFVKEGRVEAGPRTFEEKGTGAGIFSTRYKDSGVEVGYNGPTFFLNLALTSGVIGQEDRAFPSSQGGTKKAFTRRGGFITRHLALGGSVYSNDNEVADRRILRYGGFGWLTAGPFALLFEHDEGDDEAFTVSGTTQSTASYVELVWGFPMPYKGWNSYLKARYERLDPNRNVDSDLYQRYVFSYRFHPLEYLSIETAYRIEDEEPISKDNNDLYILTHLFF